MKSHPLLTDRAATNVPYYAKSTNILYRLVPFISQLQDKEIAGATYWFYHVGDIGLCWEIVGATA